jgi:hypothetical protein
MRQGRCASRGYQGVDIDENGALGATGCDFGSTGMRE